MRAHLYRTITNANGKIQTGTAVRILQPDSIPSDNMLVTDLVFSTKTGNTEIGPVFTATDGIIDVWMDTPQYVMIGVAPPGYEEYFIDNVLVLAPFSVPDPLTSIMLGGAEATISFVNAGNDACVDYPDPHLYAWTFTEKYGNAGWGTPNIGNITLVPGIYSYTAILTGNFSGAVIPESITWKDQNRADIANVGVLNNSGDFNMEIAAQPIPSAILTVGPSWDLLLANVHFTGTLRLVITRWAPYTFTPGV